MHIPAWCLPFTRWTYPILLYWRERAKSITYLLFIVCRGHSNIFNWKGSSWRVFLHVVPSTFLYFLWGFAFTNPDLRAFGACCFCGCLSVFVQRDFPLLYVSLLFLPGQAYAGGLFFEFGPKWSAFVAMTVSTLSHGSWRSPGVFNWHYLLTSWATWYSPGLKIFYLM